MAVKLDQSGTKAVMSFIKTKTSPILMKIGEQTKDELTSKWLSGKGGNNKEFATLSGTNDYLDKKAAGKVRVGKQNRGGEHIINMLLTGDLQRGLTAIKDGVMKVNVTFLDSEKKKAEGNATKRPNMMKLTTQFKDKAKAYYQKQINKFIGRTP